MTENEFGAQYQPCYSVAFVGFDSDYHPDLYVDMQLHHPDLRAMEHRTPTPQIRAAKVRWNRRAW